MQRGTFPSPPPQGLPPRPEPTALPRAQHSRGHTPRHGCCVPSRGWELARQESVFLRSDHWSPEEPWVTTFLFRMRSFVLSACWPADIAAPAEEPGQLGPQNWDGAQNPGMALSPVAWGGLDAWTD